MKKLVLVMLCAFASFAFSDSSSHTEEKSEFGVCDDAGGIVPFTFIIDCGGGGFKTVVSGTTCADYASTLLQEYLQICLPLE